MVDEQWARSLFAKGGFSLSTEQYRTFLTYERILLHYNQTINLTAITESKEIWMKHFLDSALLLQCISIPENASLIDIGTGAGFPGLVLAILRPDIQVTLLDSLKKRLNFLDDAAEKMHLKNTITVHARAEEAAKRNEYRETFDIVTARAVASLPLLMEYCIPFLKTGGVLSAMKGPHEEADVGYRAGEILGAASAGTVSYELPDGSSRRLILMQKIHSTPKSFPRRSALMKRAPLGTGTLGEKSPVL